MSPEELRELAIQRLNRRQTASAAAAAFVVVIVVLVAVWALTGDGYFWPGWAALGGLLGFTAVGLKSAFEKREFSESQIRYEISRIEGVPPPGVER